MHIPRAAFSAVAAVGLALAALCTSGSTFADAQTTHGAPHHGAYLAVNESADRSITTSSQFVAAGLVNLTMTSQVNDPNNGFDMQVFSLHPGATLGQLRSHLLPALTAPGNKPDQAAAQGITWVNEHITAYGGDQGGPSGTLRYQTVLTSGKYYVADLMQFVKTGSTASFWVFGHSRHASLPYVNQTLAMISEHDNLRFAIFNASALHDGWLRIVNTTDELHFAEFQQVKPGTTNQDITKFLNGKGPDPTIPTGGAEATDAISPYHALNLWLNVPRGRYVVICFIPDDMTGMAHAFMGMHLVTNIT